MLKITQTGSLGKMMSYRIFYFPLIKSSTNILLEIRLLFICHYSNMIWILFPFCWMKRLNKQPPTCFQLNAETTTADKISWKYPEKSRASTVYKGATYCFFMNHLWPHLQSGWALPITANFSWDWCRQRRYYWYWTKTWQSTFFFLFSFVVEAEPNNLLVQRLWAGP